MHLLWRFPPLLRLALLLLASIASIIATILVARPLAGSYGPVHSVAMGVEFFLCHAGVVAVVALVRPLARVHSHAMRVEVVLCHAGVVAVVALVRFLACQENSYHRTHQN